MKGRIVDIIGALRHFPTARDWLRAGAELLWAVPLILLVAYAGDLVRLVQPPDVATLVRLAATLFLAPALGEELLFRAALIPREDSRWQSIAVSAALFVLWHPLQVVTVGPPWASAFLDPWFLATVAILGVALARIYAASRSIWPSVVTHWAVVVTWKVFLGGPF